MSVTHIKPAAAPMLHTTHTELGEHGSFRVRTSERTEDPDHAVGVFLFQGIVSTPDDPSAVRIHQALFANPSVKRVVTIGNNGMGIDRGKDYASRSQTAADRLARIVNRYQDVGHVAVGLSLGAQTVNDMLYNAIQAKKAPDNILGVVHLGPGIVDPTRAKEMTGKLLWNVVDTTTGYVVNHPLHYLLHIGDAYSGFLELYSAIHRSHNSRQPIDHQHRMIEVGTPLEHVRAVAAHYPTAVRAGRRDAVYDTAYWHSLADSVSIGEDHNLGHEVVFTPQEAIRMIYDGIASVLSASGARASQQLGASQASPIAPLLPATA